MPNVLSPRDLVFRPDNMDETVPHILMIWSKNLFLESIKGRNSVANLRKNNDLQY